MNLTEKISYIRGLAEGLKLDDSKPEVKVINAMLDVLNDISFSIFSLEDLYDDLSTQVDDIDGDLANLESDFYHDEDCDCCTCDEYEDDESDPFYEVTCASCGQKLNVSEDVLLEGEIECPNCGELLEFDFSDLFNEDGCSDDVCSCGCCDDDSETETEEE